MTRSEGGPLLADQTISPDASRLPRLLPHAPTPGPASLDDHIARHGRMPGWPGTRGRGRLIAEVERARLSGRGGGGFPTARKLAAVVRAGGSPVVIANGTEGEPASAKDKILLAQAPHLVLDGAVIAAGLAGAAEAVIVAHPAVAGIVAAAARQRLGRRVDPVRIKVVPGAGRFVAGEASAVVNWLESGTPIPKARTARLAERGLHGRPTLVQNVETLAHLALVARHGADWFGGLGTADEPGTMLVTLAGAVRRPGVFEIAIGTPIRDVLALAGGPSAPFRALLAGGYFGRWVDAPRALDVPMSAQGLAALGASPGAGLLAVLPAGACGLVETARLARYLADESAGQCGPCVFGLGSVADQLELLASGRGGDRRRLERWTGQLRSGRGACKHPDGTISMVSSALEVFADEIGEHARGWCTGTGHHAQAGLLPVPSCHTTRRAS